MKECTKCPVSALCFSLGKHKFLRDIRQCDKCERYFYDDRPVSLPCLAYEDLDSTLGVKRLVIIPLLCQECAGCFGTQKTRKEPGWLP